MNKSQPSHKQYLRNNESNARYNYDHVEIAPIFFLFTDIRKKKASKK